MLKYAVFCPHTTEKGQWIMDIEKLMAETAEHYEKKMAGLYMQIQQLKNRCNTLQKEKGYLTKKNQELVRVIRKKNDKQHFKNGKRGTYKNGG